MYITPEKETIAVARGQEFVTFEQEPRYFELSAKENGTQRLTAAKLIENRMIHPNVSRLQAVRCSDATNAVVPVDRHVSPDRSVFLIVGQRRWSR